MLQRMEDELENFKRKFAVMMHQKGLLYREYLEEKSAWESETKKHGEENNELKRLREQDAVRVVELDRLLENLATDPDTLKTRVGELTRKITVLRVNEKALARRYTAMQDVEGSLRKENGKLKRDIVDMEGSVAARLGYLERYKEMASYKMAVLQRSLDESCPSAELAAANREFSELTAKYRDLLQREHTLVERSSKLEVLESDVAELQTEREQIIKELGNEKERCHTLEQTLADLVGQREEPGTSSVRREEINGISRKLATLEIKELNERQRADHATKRYDQIRGMMQDIEDRNGELEARVAEVNFIKSHSRLFSRDDFSYDCQPGVCVCVCTQCDSFYVYTLRLIRPISYLGACYIQTKVTKCIREKITLCTFMDKPLNHIHQDTKSARLIALCKRTLKGNCHELRMHLSKFVCGNMPGFLATFRSRNLLFCL